MYFAIDHKNNRIKAQKSLTGFCPVCHKLVKAYCGDILNHHWKHIHDPYDNCDKWHEGETEWHIAWKNEFPEDWREVIIKQGDDVHRADVRTPKGLTLELQNSPISMSEIEEREFFYGNIYWLINAQVFAQNFRLKSIVRERLRNLENETKIRREECNDDSELIKSLGRKIEDNQYELGKVEGQIEALKESTSNMENRLNHLDDSLNKLLESGMLFDHVLSKFDNETQTREAFKVIKEESMFLKKKIETLNDNISKIQNIPNCRTVGYETYKLISNYIVDSNHYAQCRLISKADRYTMFPTVVTINSKDEFERFSKSADHELIIDPKPSYLKLENEIKETQEKFRNSELNLNTKKEEVKAKLKDYLQSEMEKEAQSKKEKIDQYYEISGKLNDLTTQKAYQTTIQTEQRVFLIDELEKDHNRRRFEIMRKYKGQYFYTWNPRRPSWDNALGILFFDFGEYIGEVLSENKMKKLSRKEFISKVGTWQVPHTNNNALID